MTNSYGTIRIGRSGLHVNPKKFFDRANGGRTFPLAHASGFGPQGQWIHVYLDGVTVDKYHNNFRSVIHFEGKTVDEVFDSYTMLRILGDPDVHHWARWVRAQL